MDDEIADIVNFIEELDIVDEFNIARESRKKFKRPLGQLQYHEVIGKEPQWVINMIIS